MLRKVLASVAVNYARLKAGSTVGFVAALVLCSLLFFAHDISWEAVPVNDKNCMAIGMGFSETSCKSIWQGCPNKRLPASVQTLRYVCR